MYAPQASPLACCSPGSDFLTNRARLALGIRQNGRAVGDVELPPWASCPDVFLATMRAALEAPYVSQHLHSWIDLVFGHKQTGPAAVEADNVFYHLTYEGAVDVSKVCSVGHSCDCRWRSAAINRTSMRA